MTGEIGSLGSQLNKRLMVGDYDCCLPDVTATYNKDVAELEGLRGNLLIDYRASTD